jgi:hypothetical protein
VVAAAAGTTRPTAPFVPLGRRPVGKPESLASEWSQLSDYSGPDPAESAYKVRKVKKDLMIFLHLVYITLFMRKN